MNRPGCRRDLRNSGAGRLPAGTGAVDIILDIYTGGRRLPLKKFPGARAFGTGAYRMHGRKREMEAFAKRAGAMHFRCIMYEEKYGRSESCRKTFMRANPPGPDGMYRCVYCGRRMPPERMTVDHIIPVGAAKRKKKYQKKLKKGVNDLRNLAPACMNCNRKKLDSTALIWRVRAGLGRFDAYWVARRMLFVALLCTAAWAVCMVFGTAGPAEAAGFFVRIAGELAEMGGEALRASAP